MARPKKDASDVEVIVKKPIQRRFQEATEFFSDCFKLEMGKALKFIGWNKQQRNFPFGQHGELNEGWVSAEHVHWFHSVDSSGKIQDKCTSANGHFHKMKVERDKNGEIVEVKCVSGPMKFEVGPDQYGRVGKNIVPVNEHDKHTHETIYIKSNKLKKPVMNPEALKVISSEATLTSGKAVKSESGEKLEDLQVNM